MPNDQETQAEITTIDVPACLGGPQTEIGKQSSRRNALKHGFSSNTLELPDPERGVYERLRSRFDLEMRPCSPFEISLVDRICRNSWKLTRIAEEEDKLRAFLRALEHAAHKALSNNEQVRADEIADVQGEVGKELKLLARYEQAAERGFHKALSTLTRHRQNPELMAPKDIVPEPSQPSYAPRREVPSNVQPRINPPAPNEPRPNHPAAPQRTFEPTRNGGSRVVNGQR